MQKITPFLWFDTQAEEAANFYVSLFKNSRIVSVGRPSPAITLVTFELDGQRFMALNAGPQFKFSEAISMYVTCTDRQEVDDLWGRLTAGGGQESQCGWLKDKYGLSWQIIPEALPKLMADPDKKKAGAVVQAMLTMKKIEVGTLQQDYDAA